MTASLHVHVGARRPLATATASLRRGAAERVLHGAELLPDLIAFDGAVQLAHTLKGTPAPSGLAAPRSAEALERARRRLATIEREARSPLVDPHTGASLVPIERVAQALERAGLPAARRKKAIASAAAELFALAESRALQRIASIRSQVALVRRELGPTVAACGASAARLEQLDAQLGVATAAKVEALVGRAVLAVGDALAAELERVALALPRDAAELPLDAWAGEGGLVPEHVAQLEAIGVAVYFHERARLEMLVRATLREGLA